MADVANPQQLGPGFLVGDTYRVTRLLGKGGMGEVWEAEHTRLQGKRVAIKVLISEIAQDQEALARFHREAQIAAGLGHSNIVGIEDYNTLPDGKPYIVLEYLDGESLDARLERGAIPLKQSARILRQVGSALRAAHQAQVIHRDLKPQNVFLCEREEDGEMRVVAKVLDFGISKMLASQTVKTQTSTVLGTPQYMAPEQATGKHELVDARTDIFCLGIMAYEMLAGAPPFSGQTVPEVVFKIVYEPENPLKIAAPEIPTNVADAVHRALSKDQAERFASVGEFIEALTGRPLATATRTIPPKARAEEAMAATVASDSISALDIPRPADDIANSATMHASSATQAPVPEQATGKKKAPWLLIALAVLLVGGGGVAAALLLGGDKGKTTAEMKSPNREQARVADSRSKAPVHVPAKTPPDDTQPSAKVEDGGAATEDGAKEDAAKTKLNDTATKTEAAKPPPKTKSQVADKRANRDKGKPVDKTNAKSPANAAAGSKSQAPNTGPGDAKVADSAPTSTGDRTVIPQDKELAKIFGARSLYSIPTIARVKMRESAKALSQRRWTAAIQAANVAVRRGGGERATYLKMLAACGSRNLSVANATFRQLKSRGFRRKAHSKCLKSGLPLMEQP